MRSQTPGFRPTGPAVPLFFLIKKIKIKHYKTGTHVQPEPLIGAEVTHALRRRGSAPLAQSVPINVLPKLQKPKYMCQNQNW